MVGDSGEVVAVAAGDSAAGGLAAAASASSRCFFASSSCCLRCWASCSSNDSRMASMTMSYASVNMSVITPNST